MTDRKGFAVVMRKGREMYRIGEVSEITGVKAGTIRFYEKCGFLETVERLPNGYRVYNGHHIFQVKVCRLVFGGFVNRRLREASMKVIEAAAKWDYDAYGETADAYRSAILEDMERTMKVIEISAGAAEPAEGIGRYSRKEAARLVGTTQEAIRGWERNGLIPGGPAYQKRYYSEAVLNRMYVIRLLLDSGYSLMAILKFLKKMDAGETSEAKRILISPDRNEDLQSRADYYLQALEELMRKAETLKKLREEMTDL